MKIDFTKNLKGAIMGTVLLFAANSADAATFTAVTSGDWSVASTWSGGIAPGAFIDADDIIINSGVTVNFDTDIEISGDALLNQGSLTVDGVLNTGNNYQLTINNFGTLSGDGQIIAQRLTILGFSNFSFTGDMDIATLDNNNGNIAGLTTISSDLNISDSLLLTDGALTLSTNGNIDLGANSFVKVDEGSIAISGGLFNSTNNYTLQYVGTTNTGGVELQGSGMGMLLLDFDDNTQSLNLSADTDIAGDVMLNSGWLNLNGQRLTLMGDYNAAAGTGIQGNNGELEISSTTSLSSSIMFDSNSNSIDELMIDIADESNQSFESDFTVNNQVDLMNGGLELNSGATFVIATNGNINVMNGSIVETNGSFDGTNSYNVSYTGSSNITTGIEATGSGMNDFTINLSNNMMAVTIDSDMMIAGNLDLMNGMLNIDDNELTLMGDFSSSANGMFMTNANSKLNIMTANAFLTEVNFDAANNSMSNLTINSQNGSNVMFGSNFMVMDTLFLSNGSLDLENSATLMLDNNSSIVVSGGSLNSANGTFDGSNSYEVWYTGAASLMTGEELNGTGMTGATINLDNNSDMVTLSDDTDFNGDLMLMNGNLNIGNNNTLNIAGDFETMGSQMIMGSTTSNLMVSSSVSLTSDLMFDANSNDVDSLMIDMASGSATIGNDLNINGAIMLMNGDLDVDNGSTISVASESEIMIENGTFSTTNGSFDGTNDYSLTYMGGSLTTGAEITGSGLTSTTINLMNGSDEISLDNNTTITGMLMLENGNINLDGNDLTIEGDFDQNGGMIVSTNNSDINISSASDISGEMMFTAGSELDNLNIDIADGGMVWIGSDLTVETVAFTNGMIVITDNDLTVNSTGSITGFDEDKFIMIDGDGSLNATVFASGASRTFPVGTDDGYAPATVQINSGSNAMISVNTMNGFFEDGTGDFGNDLAITEDVVNRTWNITSDQGTTIDMDLSLQWSSAMEMNGFTNQDASITHFVNGNWDNDVNAAATTTASGDFMLTRTGITSLSPFAVKAANSNVAINENVAVEANVFPNPVIDILTYQVDSNEPMNVRVVDMAGNVVFTNPAQEIQTQQTIDFSSFPSGVYFLEIGNENGSTTKKIVKS